MGLKGPTGAELDSEETGMREKTLEVPASAKRAGLKEEGPATLGCASARCRCMCKCCFLHVNADDPVIDQALNGIPESEAVIRRVPHGPMKTAELIRIMPPRRGVR